MQAILCRCYGPPECMEIREIEKPIPKADEVLIKIHASTVTAGDCEVRSFKVPTFLWLPLRLMMGIRRPRKVLGQEVSGVIEEVGEKVSGFKKGDEIMAITGFGMGGYAEYKCQRVTQGMTFKPENMSFQEAATVPTGGLNSLHFLRKANIQPGERVLIIGAGGSIGSYGVQIARDMGAKVIVADKAVKLEMLRSIGAERVIDHETEEYLSPEEGYDVIFDVVGKTSLRKGLRALGEKGRYLLANPTLMRMLYGLYVSKKGHKKVISALAGESAQDLLQLKEMIETGKLKAVIDRQFTLDKIVEAHRYVETGMKAGHVVINIV